MTAVEKSPCITSIDWGTVRVDGASGVFKDVKLFPGGAREWDWKETGTRHAPGIQPADIEELLEKGARHVILSKGMNERLQVKSETLERLAQAGVEYEILETRAAVDRYNALADTGPTGALIHSTC